MQVLGTDIVPDIPQPPYQSVISCLLTNLKSHIQTLANQGLGDLEVIETLITLHFSQPPPLARPHTQNLSTTVSGSVYVNRQTFTPTNRHTNKPTHTQTYSHLQTDKCN